MSGVNGVPYFASIPSLASVKTQNRNAVGNSRRYVCSCACAGATPVAASPARFSSMMLSGIPLT